MKGIITNRPSSFELINAKQVKKCPLKLIAQSVWMPSRSAEIA